MEKLIELMDFFMILNVHENIEMKDKICLEEEGESDISQQKIDHVCGRSLFQKEILRLKQQHFLISKHQCLILDVQSSASDVTIISQTGLFAPGTM